MPHAVAGNNPAAQTCWSPSASFTTRIGDAVNSATRTSGGDVWRGALGSPLGLSSFDVQYRDRKRRSGQRSFVRACSRSACSGATTPSNS